MPDGIPLNVTPKSRHRIFVGLGWDPNELPSIKDKVGALIGTRKKHHDLDLSCYYFNRDHACLGYINANPQHSSNPSGSIYHSGDSVEGIGDGDDEQISVELRKLPPNVEHLIFKASIKSGHHFDEVAMPEIRLCDGYTERVFLKHSLTECEGCDAYIFVRVSRGKDKNEWFMHNINEFTRTKSPDSWTNSLASYL